MGISFFPLLIRTNTQPMDTAANPAGQPGDLLKTVGTAPPFTVQNWLIYLSCEISNSVHYDLPELKSRTCEIQKEGWLSS